ncbi:MAG: GntR family transcriptional regulator, partial [Gammaproteobacteria bacterium]|nr:GntR family transcriptional regulator [Gammaproteobacteria bacterium]
MQAPEFIDEKLRSPRYIQAYSMLRDWIYQGAYPPGAKLPPEGELCKTFGVSRITIRKAIDMLVDEK